jgi:hypothetical protein
MGVEVNPLDIECPRCGAHPYAVCRTLEGEPRPTEYIHEARREEAERHRREQLQQGHLALMRKPKT